MNRSRLVRFLLCFALLLAILGGLAGEQTALATQKGGNDFSLLPLAEEDPSPEENLLELRCLYPVLPGKSGDDFEFEVEMIWQGDEFRTFELGVTGPPKWNVAIVAGYPEKEIPAIGLEPEKTYPDKIKVRLTPLAGELPEPGDYVVTVSASSEDIQDSIELKAVVTALYRFAFYTTSGRLNTEVTAGKDNRLSIKVFNTGTDVINKVDLLSTKPSGWTITYEPTDKIEALEPGIAQELYLVIKPPRETIAGDYLVTLRALSTDLQTREIELRVTVLTPTIWGWVGIIIVLAVVAGLAVMFRRLGRR